MQQFNRIPAMLKLDNDKCNPANCNGKTQNIFLYKLVIGDELDSSVEFDTALGVIRNSRTRLQIRQMLRLEPLQSNQLQLQNPKFFCHKLAIAD